jgi:tRNA threonylcarbamoyladenosine biosynthesis protein TsaB
MAYILHLDTTTKQCSVAISFQDRILAKKELLSETYSHSEKLHSFIEEVLKLSGLDLDQLDAIAISKGPGSFTGLRIGVASAKGLCFALDIPLIALNTLEVMIQSHSIEKGEYIIPMLDARRMEVYTAVFDANKKWVYQTTAIVLSKSSFTNVVENKPCLILGDGALKFKSLNPEINAKLTPEICYPSAQHMISLAWTKFNQNSFEDLAYFEPFYLKDFQATLPKKNKTG